MRDISPIAANNLCTGCGTCAGICPTAAIQMCVDTNMGLYLPKVDKEKCADCGICVKCCPGHTVDLQKLNSYLFGKQPKDSLLGNYLSSFIGHSNDILVCSASSSGGTVTQLLIFALDKGLIDGALVTRMKKNSPLEPEPFIARSKEEIISASKSKYCPVPLNMSLKEIINGKGVYAVVGLPCHIHGIRLAEATISGLKEKIVLHIGLMCSHTVNFCGTEFLLRKFGLIPKDVNLIAYRGHGWPGSMSIHLKNGRSLQRQFIRDWNAYWNVFSCFFFTPLRCMMCPDQSNEFSDISVGDAWLSELKHCKQGESIIIARTKESDALLRLMQSSTAISLREISPHKIHESQAFSLDFKKNRIAKRLNFLKKYGITIPMVAPIAKSRVSSYVSAVLAYFSLYISTNKHLVHIMHYVPLPLFRLYFSLFKLSSLL
ncbi:MAG: Coenzyme F420 hydrogenase/dehydrogenase, beta subunit C-terminal domain [Candidatus Jordarchaeaceae archaeon]